MFVSVSVCIAGGVCVCTCVCVCIPTFNDTAIGEVEVLVLNLLDLHPFSSVDALGVL
jgi:hypothetical protein